MGSTVSQPALYDTGGALVPVFDEAGQWRGYQRPPGYVPPPPGAGTPQAGTTAPGAPEAAANAPPTNVLTFDQAAGLAPSATSAPVPAPVGFDDAIKLRPPGAAKPTQKTGLVANIGAGTTEAVTGALGLPVDLTARLLNLGVAGVNKATGAGLPQIDAPVGGTEWWNKVAGLIGANPEDVGARDTIEELARAGARGAASVAVPALGAGALSAGAVREALAAGAHPVGVAAGGAGGVTGQTFADFVPPEWKGVADVAGQLAGGGLVLGGAAAARPAANLVRGAARAVTGPGGTPEPIVNPATGQPFAETVGPEPGVPGGPIMGAPAAQRMAAQRMARAMGQSPADAAAAIAAAPEPPLPGSQPTVGQITGNIGQLGRERQLRQLEYGRLAFNESEAQRDVARVAALDKVAPADAGRAAGDWFGSKLAAEEAAGAADIAGAREAAGTATTAAGVRDNLPGVQQIGAEQQAALESLREPVKAALGRGYDAFDPDGTKAIDTTPIYDAARQIEAELGKGGEFVGVEQPLIKAAQTMRGVNPFSDWQSFKSNLAAALRRIAKNPEFGRESQPYRRLSLLMQATHEALIAAADRAAAAEVESGAAAGDRIIDRLREIDASAGPLEPGSAGGVAGEPAGAAAAGAPGAGGVAAAAAPAGPAGPGGAARDRGVAAGAAAAPAPRSPEDAVTFLISRGGVRPDPKLSEDVASVHHRQGGRLLNPRGMSLNHAREALAEERFLSGADAADEDAAADYISNAAAEHIAGRKVYRPEDEAEADAYEQARQEQSVRGYWNELYRSQVLEAEAAAGLRLSDGEIDHATELMIDSDGKMLPEEALRQAAAAGEEVGLQENAVRNAFGHPGIPLAEQQVLDLPPADRGLVENLNPSDAATIRAIDRDYATYKTDWRSGAVGDVLASGAAPGSYRLAASAVPGRLFRAGPAGAEAADSLIRAAGGVEQAQAILGDYPARLLRDAVMKNGVWNDANYARFMQSFGPALAKFPAIARRFATAAEAQRQIDAAAARNEARLDELRNSAAGAYLGKGGEGVDPQRAITRLLQSDNVGAAFRDLMRRAAPSKAAIEGVQRNLVDVIKQRARTQQEAGTTEVKALSKNAFQRTLADPKVAAAVEAVLTPAQRRVLAAIGEDMDLGARAWNAVKIPGSPGTASDLHALAAHDGPSALLNLWLAEKGGEILSHLVGLTAPWAQAVAEGAGILAGATLRARRAAALASVDRLETEMAINPALGRLLLERLGGDRPALAGRRLAQRFMALTAGTAANRQGGP